MMMRMKLRRKIKKMRKNPRETAMIKKKRIN
jgi:hypothetical protein